MLNNNIPPPQSKPSMTRKKIKIATGRRFNSASLLKSTVFSVSSNGVANCLKNLGSKSENIFFRSRQHLLEAWLL